MKKRIDFDPVSLEIMWNRLLSIAEEQAKTLIRASFSTVVGEMEDLACALYDGKGRIISQAATGTQGVLFGMTRGMTNMLARYPIESLAKGDVLLGNDPWFFSGHKYDITVAMPVFQGRRPVGLVATILHGSDIGGISSPGDAREVYEEGLELPIMKLFKKGKLNDDLVELIKANVRIPDQVIGDLMAQVSANEVASQKLLEFMDEHRLKSLIPLSDAIISRSREAVRKEIEALPDGEYSNEVGLDGVDEPLKVCVRLRIKGAELTVDFAGSSPQTNRGGINSVYNFTFAYSCHALKSALVPDVPNNEGMFYSFRVDAPEGCLVNAKFPASVMARYVMVPFLSAAVMGALAHAAPEKVLADSAGGTMTLVTGSGPGEKGFVYWLVGWGGMGARPDKDGISATSYPANVGNVSVEIMENVSPLFVLERELVPDSCGAGKFRGGCDQRASITVRGDKPAVVHAFFERTKNPAKGSFGGLDGGCGDFVINGQLRPPPKEKYVLNPGDKFSFCQGGGGGIFSPLERPVEMVLRDVVNEYISPESALKKYKVAINLADKTIDWQETERLRGEV